MTASSLHLDVVIDVVCPWCFLGKRRIDAAIAAVPEIAFTRRYRPFQLDPTIPKAGRERKSYMLGKFGSQARIDEAHARLEALGEAEDIPFDFGAITVAPNTLDAHRLIRWASQAGLGEEAAERLFALYFLEGRDIGRPEVLIEAGRDVGLDASEIDEKLRTGADLTAVEEEIAFSGRMGITGVPCTIVASKFAISGAQSVDVLVEAFREIAGKTDA